MSAAQPRSASQKARDYVREHPFTATLGLWGGVLIGTGVYVYNRQIPTQLKIIQARILAQAGLIIGAVSLGGVTWLTHQDEGHTPAASSWKLRSYDRTPVHTEARPVPVEASLPAPQPVARAPELK